MLSFRIEDGPLGIANAARVIADAKLPISCRPPTRGSILRWLDVQLLHCGRRAERVAPLALGTASRDRWSSGGAAEEWCRERRFEAPWTLGGVADRWTATSRFEA